MFNQAKEKDYFIENLAMLLAAGVDVVLALDSISAEIRSGKMKKILIKLQSDIENGQNLWRALESTRLLSSFYIALIKIGEETGRLPQNLQMVAAQQKKDRNLSAKLQSAMLYPAIVFTTTIIIGLAIAWFLLPRLALVFVSLKIPLPLITKILIAVGTFLGAYGIIVVPLLLALIFGIFYIFFLNPRTKSIGQSLLFHFPGMHDLISEIELSRFGYILGNLLSSGIPVATALDSLSQAAAFSPYRKLYMYLQKSIEEGKSFQKSFAQNVSVCSLVPRPVQQLIISAEQAGSLPDTLLKIGQNYEEKTEVTTKNLTVILEPILLVIVWLGVMAIAIAIILPIYSLIGQFNP